MHQKENLRLVIKYKNMSKIDDLITSIDIARKNPNKKELWDIIKEVLVLLNEINEDYKKFYEDSEENPAILKSIEEKYLKIKKEYDDLFSIDETGISKSSELQKKINEIVNYHKSLLEDTTEEESIKTDIESSQKHITDFYNFLFNKEEGDKNNEEKVKKSIEEIKGFYEKLMNAENGIKTEVEDAYKILIDKYNELFKIDENSESKINTLEKNIENISSFGTKVEEEIKPFINNVKEDIVRKQKDIDALLVGATGGSLVEGYLQSKNEYRQKPKYSTLEGDNWNVVFISIKNSVIFLINTMVIIFEYILFIFPLIIAVLIFVRPDIIGNFSIKEGTDLTEYFKNLDFLSRLTISLPLWWISWFGQRSISQKRRLSEEYNHKAQVTKMYLNFSARETQDTYQISKDARKELDLAIISVIKRHPGQIFGKDETMLDKIIQAVKATRGVSEKKDDYAETNIDKE